MDPIVIGETYIFTRRPEYEGDPLDSQVLTVTDIDDGIVEAEGADGDEGEFTMANRVRNYSQLNTRIEWTAARIVERMLTTPRRMMPRFLTTTPTHMVSSISRMMNVEGGRRKRRVSRKKLSRKKSRKAKKSRKTRR